MNEWDSGIYPRVNLSPEYLTWDSSNPSYAEHEDSMTGFNGDIVVNDPAASGHTLLVINFLTSLALDEAHITDDYNFSNVLDSHASISILGLESGVGSIKTSPNPKIEHTTLCKRCASHQTTTR